MGNPNIISIQEKKLVGKNIEMSMMQDKTQTVWQSFIPYLSRISNRISNDKISMQIYPKGFYQNFDPKRSFTKWATVEVNSFDNLPEELETFILPKGLYAVFQYKGKSNEISALFAYIFSEWLPKSDYQVDHRPHFELLGERYKNNDPNSEEEIWIPISIK